MKNSNWSRLREAKESPERRPPKKAAASGQKAPAQVAEYYVSTIPPVVDKSKRNALAISALSGDTDCGCLKTAESDRRQAIQRQIDRKLQLSRKTP